MATNPEILRFAKRFHTDLIRANDIAIREISQAYMEAWRRISLQLKGLTEAIATIQATGEEVSAAKLYREYRYQQLLNQLYYELKQLESYVTLKVTEEQKAAYYKGITHSHKLLVTEGKVAATWLQLPYEASERLVGFLANGSPLSYKFSMMSEAVAQDIREYIAASMVQGTNPRLIAKGIQRLYDVGFTNALVTCRTEAMRAYRVASHENYIANKSVVRGWVWTSARDSRTCAACWGMDGTFHSLDEVMSSHPACRCTSVPSTKPWSEITPGVKVKETSIEGWDPTSDFNNLSPANQQRILGPTRLKMYRQDIIGVRDFATKSYSKTWGTSYHPTTLKEFVSSGKIDQEQLQAMR